MFSRRRSVPLVLAVTAAAAVVLGGCSGSSGAVHSGTATGAPATSRAAIDVADSGAGSAAGGAPAPAPDPASTQAQAQATLRSKVFAEPAACASVAQAYGAVLSAMLPVLQGGTGSTAFDADKLDQALAAPTMGTIPAELAPDFAAIAAAAERVHGEDLTAAAAVLNGPEVTAATDHIDTFLSDHC